MIDFRRCWANLVKCMACRKYPGTTIVTDSVTSDGLSQYIGGLGGRHFRYRRGYKNVINKGIELNKDGTDCQLMMETRRVLACAGALTNHTAMLASSCMWSVLCFSG